MNRREFVAGVTALSAAASAQGQSIFVKSDPAPTEQELEAAYVTCRQRGHVATAWGNGRVSYSDGVWHVYPDRPATGYQERTETPWDTCFYCKKQFRFVTTQEEK